LTLTEIRAEIERRAAMIGASANFELPTYGKTEDFARPHIEVDSRGYHRVIVERGVEINRITTHDLDELLFHVFSAVTFSLACHATRVKGEDLRRGMFRRQIELLAKLDTKWAERGAREHQQILQENPFIDGA
jgi:hypothetical protein